MIVSPRLICASLILLLAVTAAIRFSVAQPAASQSARSADYRVISVSSASDGFVASANYRLYSTTGETASGGVSSSAHYSLASGFIRRAFMPPAILCPGDSECDGYSDTQAAAISKPPLLYCPVMRADIDGDGVISILDLSRVARDFGKPIPPADPRNNQDGDTLITILDLAKQASVYGHHVTDCP